MRFWYRIGMSHEAEIKASIHSSNTTRQLWKSALHTEKWNFVQLPITTNATARVITITMYSSCIDNLVDHLQETTECLKSLFNLLFLGGGGGGGREQIMAVFIQTSSG